MQEDWSAAQAHSAVVPASVEEQAELHHASVREAEAHAHTDVAQGVTTVEPGTDDALSGAHALEDWADSPAPDRASVAPRHAESPSVERLSEPTPARTVLPPDAAIRVTNDISLGQAESEPEGVGPERSGAPRHALTEPEEAAQPDSTPHGPVLADGASVPAPAAAGDTEGGDGRPHTSTQLPMDEPAALPALAATAPTQAAVPTDVTPSSPSFVAAAQRRAFWSSWPIRLMLWLVLFALLLGLAVQAAISQRDWLAAREPRLTPLLQGLCKPLDCTVSPYRLLDAIVIDSSAFNRASGDEFRFSVVLRNTSDMPVATPALELVLTDVQDRQLIRRVVTAAELGAPATLAPRDEFSGVRTLTVADSNVSSAITGYRLMAFYP